MSKETDEGLSPNGTVNGTPCFEWMESWLDAYQKENKDIDVKKIMEWIDCQDMCS